MEIQIKVNFENLGDKLKKTINQNKDFLKNQNEILGYIIAIFHFLITFTILSLIIVSHTLYPSVLLKTFLFIVLFIIWLQHIIFDVCVISLFEKSITKGTITPYHDILCEILGIFGLTIEDYDKYLLVVEGVAVGCFGLELFSHFSSSMMNMASNKA